MVIVDEGYNWKSIILSLLVIGTVIAGIVTAIYLLGYVDELLYWSGRRMTLDEYLQVREIQLFNVTSFPVRLNLLLHNYLWEFPWKIFN